MSTVNEESGLPADCSVIVWQEGETFVAWCPQLDIASQGVDEHEARMNLQEAVELFLEAGDPSEVARRMGGKR